MKEMHPDLRRFRRVPGTRHTFYRTCAVCGHEFRFRNHYLKPLRKNAPRTCCTECSRALHRRERK